MHVTIDTSVALSVLHHERVVVQKHPCLSSTTVSAPLSAAHRHDLEEMKPCWKVCVAFPGGASIDVEMESGQTYGDLKKQLIKLEEQAAEGQAKAASENGQARQVSGVTVIVCTTVCLKLVHSVWREAHCHRTEANQLQSYHYGDAAKQV